MQKLYLFFIALFISCSSIAQLTDEQIQQIDSLKKVISIAKHDTIKVNALVYWDNIIYVSDPQLDLELNKQIQVICENNLTKQLSEKEIHKFKKSIAASLNNIGNIYEEKGDYAKAMGYYTKSLKNYEGIGVKEGIAKSLNNIGLIYNKQGDFAKAIDYHTRSLKINEELGVEKSIAVSLNNIGIIYQEQGDYAKAIDYYTRSLKIKEKIGNKNGIANSLNNIGLIYNKQGDFAKAIDYHIRSLKISEKIGNKNGIAMSLNNIGNIYEEKGDYAKAIDYHTRSLKMTKEIGDKKGIAGSLINIGDIYYEQGDYAKALKKKTKALSIAQEIGVVLRIRDASNNLWKIYKKLGKHQQALEIHELYIQMRDSILSEENQKAAIHLDYKYKYEKQAAADSVVNAEADKVKNAQLVAEKAENKQHILEASQQKQQKYFLYGILALALLFGGFIFNRFRITNKQKNLIETQHHKLNETHREITDSINYAKKIQDAIMTSSVYIQEVLPESFIFFQPKDVVSGDFYWVHQSPTGHIYFTVADCTGHGVPGAFMSMIGNSMLNEIIIENKIDDPAQILNNMRDHVIQSLKQKGIEGENKDGMDMALCKLDPVKRTLEYSGAYNPLIYIRDKEIKQIKGDAHPIGLYTGKKAPFTNHQVKLKKGDMLYIYSDGFADQFGGNKDKKYMSGKFKKFLLEISEMPTDQQEYLLKVEFTDWLGSYEQIDDVCVMGVRV